MSIMKRCVRVLCVCVRTSVIGNFLLPFPQGIIPFTVVVFWILFSDGSQEKVELRKHTRTHTRAHARSGTYVHADTHSVSGSLALAPELTAKSVF